MTLISITKAAEVLGIARATAYRLAREGQIPCVRSLGPLRVHLEMLNEMIDAEAKASMAAEDGLGPRASSVLPNSYFQPGQRSEAAMEREFDELLRIAKPKTQRNR